MSELNGSGVEFDAACCKRGGSCACGGDVCGKDSRRATPPSPSTAEDERAVALATLKRFWTGDYWEGVTKSDCEKIDKAFAALSANAADSEAKELDAADAARFRKAIALEDNADTLHAAVLNNAPDLDAIRNEFDATIKATQKEKQ